MSDPKALPHTRQSQASTRNTIIQLTSLDRYTGLRNHRMRFQDAFDINGERVDKANEQDIILGRGKNLQDFPGNKRMRQITDKYIAIYRTLQRSQKRNLVETVYKEIVSNGARFLTKAPNKANYLLVDVEVALQKISNSLRCMKAYKRSLFTARRHQGALAEALPVSLVSSSASYTAPRQSFCQQPPQDSHDKTSMSKKPLKTPNSLNLCMTEPISGPQNLGIITTLRYLNHCKRLRLSMTARMMSSMALGRSIRLQSSRLSGPTPEARARKSNHPR